MRRPTFLSAYPVMISLLFGFSLLPAAAETLGGTWLRDNGASRIRFAPCGELTCGTIVWLKDVAGPAKIGQRIFFDLRADGADRWVGKAFNPEDGKSYAGKIHRNGGQIVTEGCALAGMICRTIYWSKVE